MLSSLLTCASRSLSASSVLRCPTSTVSARAVDGNLVNARTVDVLMQALGGHSKRCFALDACPASRQPSMPRFQQQLPHSRAHAVLAVTACSPRQQRSPMAAQACGSSGCLQQAMPAARHPEPSVGCASRPRLCGSAGVTSSQHWQHSRHRWQHPRQLSAAHNFSLWTGGRDKSQDEAVER